MTVTTFRFIFELWYLFLFDGNTTNFTTQLFLHHDNSNVMVCLEIPLWSWSFDLNDLQEIPIIVQHMTFEVLTETLQNILSHNYTSFLLIKACQYIFHWNSSTLVQTSTTKMPAFWGYPPLTHDNPSYWVILDLKWKEDKVNVTNLKNSPKFQILELWNKHYTQHMLWSYLIRCANMKWVHQYCWRCRADTILSTDGQTDKVKPAYPLSTLFKWRV